MKLLFNPFLIVFEYLGNVHVIKPFILWEDNNCIGKKVHFQELRSIGC